MNDAAIDEKQNRRCDAQQSLHKEVAEDLDRSRERRHRGIVASGLEQLEQIVQRTLIEGRNHRLGDVAEKKWLMPKLAPGNGFTQ